MILSRGRRFAYYGTPLAEAAFAALGERASWSTRTLDLGLTRLRGLVRKPAREGAPFVLFFAGNGGALLEGAQRTLDALIGDRGWGGAAWAYRGFDGSTGTPTPDVLAEDARRVHEDLGTRDHVSSQDVHLVGFSLGAHVSCALAAGLGEGSARPASVSLLAPPAEVVVSRASLFGRFGPTDRYDTMRFLPRIAAPVCVVHGTADATLPLDEARSVANALGARARFVEVPGVGHADLLESALALSTVRAMIEDQAEGARRA